MPTPTPMSYYGSKGGDKSAWIAGLLPHEQKTTYIEPCGGMGRVLLHRAPVNNEMLNDKNGRLINWCAPCGMTPTHSCTS